MAAPGHTWTHRIVNHSIYYDLAHSIGCVGMYSEGVLAVRGVSSEPFSGPNSLLTGNNTGKFANFSP
jgi:hypothetical protein